MEDEGVGDSKQPLYPLILALERVTDNHPKKGDKKYQSIARKMHQNPLVSWKIPFAIFQVEMSRAIFIYFILHGRKMP